MYAVRIYKNYDTNKLEVVRVVNSQTLQCKDYNVKELKTILRFDKNAVKNLELDTSGQVRLKRFGSKRVNYYREVYEGKYKIRLYCIITSYNQSMLSFIADRYGDSIVRVDNATIGEIATALKTTLDNLKLFNGNIEKIGNRWEVSVFKDNGTMYKLPLIQKDSINNIFGNTWEVDIIKTTQAGVELDFIKPSKPAGVAVIPEGVSYIQEFGEGVNHLELPNSLLTLGDKCFEDSDDLISIKLGRGLKIIPYGCFNNSCLQEVKFSGYEREICESAFEECYKLKGVIITNARIIGRRAFTGTAINKVKLLKVVKIDCEAFAYNDKLTSVELGDQLQNIMGGAFRDCCKLTEIVIPPSVRMIGKLAFSGCNKLKTVKISRNTQFNDNSFPKKTKIIYY